MKLTIEHLNDLANKSRENVGALQALVALGHWPQDEPIIADRLREILVKVRHDIVLLELCEAELEAIT